MPQRMTRTKMLEVLRQDYIRTAWSKGLKERVVVLRHTINNALIPVVTRSAGLIGRAAAAQPLCGLQLPILVGDTCGFMGEKVDLAVQRFMDKMTTILNAQTTTR